jgi:hypothetical protein
MAYETEQYDELPEALIRRLQERERAVATLTPAVDRAVLAAAREHFGASPAQAPQRRRWYYPAAAAAAAALVALLIARPFEHGEVEAMRMADDVDGSGRVDVLDVFALARARAQDAGAVSQSRIDELADRIVSLAATEVAL